LVLAFELERASDFGFWILDLGAGDKETAGFSSLSLEAISLHDGGHGLDWIAMAIERASYSWLLGFWISILGVRCWMNE